MFVQILSQSVKSHTSVKRRCRILLLLLVVSPKCSFKYEWLRDRIGRGGESTVILSEAAALWDDHALAHPFLCGSALFVATPSVVGDVERVVLGVIVDVVAGLDAERVGVAASQFQHRDEQVVHVEGDSPRVLTFGVRMCVKA